jgi:flavodoxin I
MGVIYECLNKKGCDIIGYVSTEGYEYEESRAVINGKFIGLPLDYENQDKLTSDRISNWLDQIKPEFN